MVPALIVCSFLVLNDFTRPESQIQHRLFTAFFIIRSSYTLKVQ